MRTKKYNIQYKKSIENWDEALPLGNGKLGCLIYGDGPLRFALDKIDLWDRRPHPATKEDGFNYNNLVRLVKSGSKEDWEEYERLFDKICSDFPYPTKITAGRIELDLGEKVENFLSEVDLATAVAHISCENKSFFTETFMSATEYVGVAKVQGKYLLHIHIPEYISGDKSVGGLQYPQADIVEEDGFIYYVQKTLTDFCYGIMVYRKTCADGEELYFTIMTGTCKNISNMISTAKQELIRVSRIGYQQLKTAHIVWWRNYWKQSELAIPDELLEKTYYRAWYLFASCSRKGFYPMPLQGVWTADNEKLPPWKGDYHHDTNTQLSYQAFLKANRLEEGRVFIDYLWEMKDTFTAFAKDFFGVNGILLPSCSTIDGQPIGGWAHYAFSPTMTIWAIQSFDEYYLYTGDEDFLRSYAYPYFQGVGKAISGLLEEHNGKLYLPLSSSPEIYDATREAYLKPNSNFDLALIKYLYKTLVFYANKLGDNADEYMAILEKLDEIAIDKEGVVLLDQTQRLPESHRHFSHVMCMYPLHILNYDTEENKRIYQSTLLHLEQLGTGWWAGFSFAMSAQLYAMAHNGNAAYEKLRIFAKGFVADNGFHLNGDFKHYGFSQWHYRPFTLESLFGYCDALQEMLLQEHQGYLDIFPAIPRDWEKAHFSFKNLRSYNGVLVSAKWKGGRILNIELKASKETEIYLKNCFEAEYIYIKTKEGVQRLQAKKGYFHVKLEGGDKKLIYTT